MKTCRGFDVERVGEEKGKKNQFPQVLRATGARYLIDAKYLASKETWSLKKAIY